MAEAALPELATVPWRGRVDARYLQRRGWLWTLQTVAFVVPFTAAGIVLIALEPLAVPVALASFAHGWVIPELHAFRGSNTIRPPRGPRNERAEPVAQGLLGDLLGHDAARAPARDRPRDGARRSSASGCSARRAPYWWRMAAGAFTASASARPSATCRPSDRIAHLLLALRTDEEGLATVANHAFSGAPWRLRRRIRKEQRPGAGRGCTSRRAR